VYLLLLETHLFPLFGNICYVFYCGWNLIVFLIFYLDHHLEKKRIQSIFEWPWDKRVGQNWDFWILEIWDFGRIVVAARGVGDNWTKPKSLRVLMILNRSPACASDFYPLLGTKRSKNYHFWTIYMIFEKKKSKMAVFWKKKISAYSGLKISKFEKFVYPRTLKLKLWF
jgi:hypothetical protein